MFGLQKHIVFHFFHIYWAMALFRKFCWFWATKLVISKYFLIEKSGNTDTAISTTQTTSTNHIWGPSKYDENNVSLESSFQWTTVIVLFGWLISRTITVICCNHHSCEIQEWRFQSFAVIILLLFCKFIWAELAIHSTQLRWVY